MCKGRGEICALSFTQRGGGDLVWGYNRMHIYSQFTHEGYCQGKHDERDEQVEVKYD